MVPIITSNQVYLYYSGTGPISFSDSGCGEVF